MFLAIISKDINVLRKSTFFNKIQQIQFANRVKKTENVNRKNTRKKQKILHNLERTPDEILKVRGKNFLGCCGYLPKGKSLKVHGQMLLQERSRGSSPTVPILSLLVALSITNILTLRSTHPKSYN